MAEGRTAEEAEAAGVPADQVAHRTFPGNRPSTTILAPDLTPAVLGQLIAMYEHSVFTQGVTRGLNSFDPWRAALGMAVASEIQ